MESLEALEYIAWLKSHDNFFKWGRYTPDQVAYFAKLNGFSQEVIYSPICERVMKEVRLDKFQEKDLFIDKWHRLIEINQGIDE